MKNAIVLVTTILSSALSIASHREETTLTCQKEGDIVVEPMQFSYYVINLKTSESRLKSEELALAGPAMVSTAPACGGAHLGRRTRAWRCWCRCACCAPTSMPTAWRTPCCSTVNGTHVWRTKIAPGRQRHVASDKYSVFASICAAREMMRTHAMVH